MKKVWGLVLILMAVVQYGDAQTRYIVRFRNKATNPFSLSNPSAYLSPRSVQRRTNYSIIIDSTDLPVTPRYVDSLRSAGIVTILNISKWLNSVSIQTTDAAALTKINNLSFVLSVTSIAARGINLDPIDKFLMEKTEGTSQQREQNILSDFFSYGSSFNQVHIHNGEFLHNIGLRGQNMVIGILDAGFKNYLTVKAFDSVRANGQILGLYDFVAFDNSVNEDDSHGMECFSTIGANIPGQFVGTAPKANFYLFRSEDASSEYPIEEHNWVCAAERVDSVGGDLISSSLGYTTFDAPFGSSSHTYAEMNGNTTMAAVGADLAAKKGILVVNSAGNEGTNTWHYIATPADADSVLAVGAVNGAGVVANFSSYGPSSDGQVKPDVASVGVSTVIELPSNTVGTGNGTSFSAPNMAGLTTCLWQGFPEFNNMKIINSLRLAGSIASAPDDRIGYGIPDVKKSLMFLLKDFATSNASLSNCKTTLNWTSKDVSAMKYEIERKLPGQTNFLKIAEQFGSGSLFATRPSYQYQDILSTTPAGTISYRIRQIIDTSVAGFFADYIDTATVTTGACNATAINPVYPGEEMISVSPNPARAHLNIKIKTVTAFPKFFIRIFNTKGQLISVIQKAVFSGTTIIEIPISGLAKGKYYLSFYNVEQLISTKEVIKL